MFFFYGWFERESITGLQKMEAPVGGVGASGMKWREPKPLLGLPSLSLTWACAQATLERLLSSWQGEVHFHVSRWRVACFLFVEVVPSKTTSRKGCPLFPMARVWGRDGGEYCCQGYDLSFAVPLEKPMNKCESFAWLRLGGPFCLFEVLWFCNCKKVPCFALVFCRFLFDGVVLGGADSAGHRPGGGDLRRPAPQRGRLGPRRRLRRAALRLGRGVGGLRRPAAAQREPGALCPGFLGRAEGGGGDRGNLFWGGDFGEFFGNRKLAGFLSGGISYLSGFHPDSAA